MVKIYVYPVAKITKIIILELVIKNVIYHVQVVIIIKMKIILNALKVA